MIMPDNKILIVDDDKEIIKLLEMVFLREGYDVRTALSAERALELLKDEIIHVMFFDLNLPGINGIELCQEIKKDLPMSIIYAVTGYASLFDLAECREAGFDDYFTKPVNLKMLTKSASNAFEKLNRWKTM
jgi:DNA-binding response OmpR family regulator